MHAPERIDTARLVLRRPAPGDAAAIFARYASDSDVTRFVGWPTHQSVEDTRLFLTFADAEWTRWPAGPYLIESRDRTSLLGGTGLAFDAPDRASTGYVLAKDAWGQGYATEALLAMVDLAGRLAVRRLIALCHPDHEASQRVLIKGGFAREGAWPHRSDFPNLERARRTAPMCYARSLPALRPS